MTAARKTAVSLCHQETNEFTNCNGTGLATDNKGIPADQTATAGFITSITTTAGVILANTTAEISQYSYQISPTYDSVTGIGWVTAGTCLTVNLCSND